MSVASAVWQACSDENENIRMFMVEANNIEYGNIEDRNIEFDVK